MTARVGPPPEGLREMICEMLQYARKHPSAKDSAAGVHQFWLSHGGERWPRESVERGLEWLRRAGALRVRNAGCERLYSVLDPEAAGSALEDAT